MVAVCLMSASLGGGALAQSIYQPGFRESAFDNAYSARSVELNYHYDPWKSRDDSAEAASELHVRASQIGGQPALLIDGQGNAAVNDLSSEDWTGDIPDTGTELFYGARMIAAGDLSTFSPNSIFYSPNDLAVENSSSTVALGPQLGLKSTYRIRQLTCSARLSTAIAYQDRALWQTALVGEDVTPSRYSQPLISSRQSYSRNAESVNHLAELRFAAQYWFSSNAHLNLSWTNTYLSSIMRRTPPVDYVLYEDGQVLGRSEETTQGTWFDTLQLSFLVTR